MYKSIKALSNQCCNLFDNNHCIFKEKKCNVKEGNRCKYFEESVLPVNKVLVIKKELDNVMDTLSTWPNYCDKYELYSTMVPITWEYSQQRPYKAMSSRVNAGCIYTCITTVKKHWRMKRHSTNY